MRTRWLLIALFSSQAFSSLGQRYALSSFRETSPPPASSAASFALSYAPGYGVKNVAGTLVVGKEPEAISPSLRTPEGTFRGRDNGEWGGQLVFQPKKRRARPVLLKEGNIRFLFQLQGSLYFIEGLVHGTYNGGALYQITGKAPTFTWTKLLDFEDAPQAFAVVGTEVYIAHFQGFTILRNLHQERVLEKTFWAHLYPNSVALFPNEEVCIGLRGGYVRLNTRTKAVRFFQHLP